MPEASGTWRAVLSAAWEGKIMGIYRDGIRLTLEDETICESAQHVPGLISLVSLRILKHKSGGCVVQLLRPKTENCFGPILGIQELSLISQWVSKAIGASVPGGGLCGHSLPGWVDEQITISGDEPEQITKELKSENKHGYIYLAKDPLNAVYKIGQSKRPEIRINGEISPKYPYDLKIIAIHETVDMVASEKLIHAIYANKRLNGEWFKLDDSDIDKIQDIMDGFGITQK